MKSDFAIIGLEVFVLRAPALPPVQTSFGVMHSRPALLVRVQSETGQYGWGEVWCNFPSVGAEHRARMTLAYLKPVVCSQRWESPRHCFETLSSRFEILALQTGEPGTFHQIIAGLDIAIWDMTARGMGLPLWKLLGQHQSGALPKVAVYASGLNPDHPERLAEQKWAEGHRAFKLKVGFGSSLDERNLNALRTTLGDQATLMADANQAWSLSAAIEAGKRYAQFDLRWLEEPIRADSPQADWAHLAHAQAIALAAGENFSGVQQFHQFATLDALSILQPDVGKWGGFSACLAVAQTAIKHGKTVCPHWLGGGVGLMAALQLKAAIGGPGYVEVDANPNPLRDKLLPADFSIEDGYVTLSDRPGLGVEPDIDACGDFIVPLG